MIMTWGIGPSDEKCSCDVFDANGRQIHHVVMLNTETGYIVRAKHNDALELEFDENFAVLLIHQRVPAPLRLQWYDHEREQDDPSRISKAKANDHNP